jgi:2-polyprenyl-3-methyl-5-hydroxy-6-metoxy-1,4-benzoquinol methylase
MEQKKYLNIVTHYEACLEKYGDTHRGVDWPNRADTETRYQVMLEVIQPSTEAKVSLLDFGCGASHLYEFMLRHDLTQIAYSGLDISEKFIYLSQSKFPSVKYYCLDILENSIQLPNFDYVVMNGVFTEKRNLTFEEMWEFCKSILRHIFPKVRFGLAFNVMSSHVNWEREDLFHLPFDLLAGFLKEELSRNFVIRNDYGLYEYTTYVYRRGEVWQR